MAEPVERKPLATRPRGPDPLAPNWGKSDALLRTAVDEAFEPYGAMISGDTRRFTVQANVNG